jgi:hypothetical protein
MAIVCRRLSRTAGWTFGPESRGTGRFAGASGSAAIVVEQNFVTGAYTFTMVGNVNY